MVEGTGERAAAGPPERSSGVRMSHGRAGGTATLALVALGGATPHEGRDGEAFESWDATEARPPQETPLPDDLPAGERRE